MATLQEERKKGAPLWMVSFGDMMTLILTFFILLVSLSKEQQNGLLAKGVGSFMASVRSMGLPALMEKEERIAVFNEVRMKFRLPPEADPERREDPREASSLELLRAESIQALRPRRELQQPAVAVFQPGSVVLPVEARRYLDLLATTLRPGYGELLVLEGHAGDAVTPERRDALAYARARAVRTYLIDEHRFQPHRVEARAWLEALHESGTGARMVDARLLAPATEEP